MAYNLADPKTRDRIRALLRDHASDLSLQELELLERELATYEEEVKYAAARRSFLAFCHLVYPGFKEGPHHRILAPLLEDIAFGRNRFLAVSISPRHGKSEFISYLFTAWYMGLYPANKLMMATHTASLSESFGRRVRNLIDEEAYQKIFPATALAADSKSASAWNTSAKGSAFYTGVGGAIAGRGANCLVVDDPHNESEALSGNPRIFEEAYEWYGLAFQRLQSKGICVIIHTRWAKNDLIGKVLEQAQNNPLAPQYKYIELPLELPSGEPLWPEMFDKDDIQTIKNAIPPHRWMAQYQQQPTNAENALVPMDAWALWTDKRPPEMVYTFISLDSAIEANNRADFSVFGVFGIFDATERSASDEDEPEYCLMLLDVIKDRLEYPELKSTAIRLCEKWVPDRFIIEKKASGQQLLQDLRRMRLPVFPAEPIKDKYARLQQVTDLFHDGLVYAPDNYRWADDFRAAVADFPGGTHDDECVREGTLIRMADGTAKTIESVRVGDWVETPLGAQRVTAAACTGERTVSPLVAGGCTVWITGNHPIATSTGWRLPNEANDAIVLPHSEGNLWQKMYNTTTGTPTTAALDARILRVGGTITAARGWQKAQVKNWCYFIAKFGKTITGLFRQGIKSTASMEIPEITAWPIWNVSVFTNIQQNTARNARYIPVAKRNRSIWRRSTIVQRRGIEVRKGAYGTSITRCRLEKAYPRGRKRSVPAVRSSYRHSRSKRFVAASALIRRVLHSASWTHYVPQIARLAGPHSGHTPRERYSVHASAVKTRLSGCTGHERRDGTTHDNAQMNGAVKHLFPEQADKTTAACLAENVPATYDVRQRVTTRVYNLTVENAQCYYANDILVHNCDCLSQALMFFKKGQFAPRKQTWDTRPDDNDAPPAKSGYYRIRGVA